MSKRSLSVIDNCEDCGACCTGQAALPIHLIGKSFKIPGVTPLTPELEQELKDKLAIFKATRWPADGEPCIWYDSATKKCKHYDYRPTICRDNVKPGDKACRRWRESVGIDAGEPKLLPKRFEYLIGKDGLAGTLFDGK